MLLAREGQTVNYYDIKRQAITIIQAEWNNKGGRAYWREIKDDPPIVQHVMDVVSEALAEGDFKESDAVGFAV